MPEYYPTETGYEFVETPQPTPMPEPEDKGDDMGDLFEVPQENDNDIYAEDLLEVDDEDIIGSEDGDLSDLTSVPYDDIMGRRPEPKTRPKPKYGLVRKYGGKTIPPNMGGIRY